MHQHVLSPIDTARTLVAEERAEVEAERDAFATFGERVAAIKPLDAVPSTGPTAGPIRVITNDTSPTASVRAAYRATVMAVDHYPATYAESLARNLQAELGPDIASALHNDAPFTPTFKRHVEAAVTDARAQREQVLEILASEDASLERSHEGFASIVAGLQSRRDGTDARATDESVPLKSLAARFQSLLDRRCEVIQSRPLPGRLDGHDLCTYLYRSPSWTYPVLTVGATIAKDLRALQERQDGQPIDVDP